MGLCFGLFGSLLLCVPSCGALGTGPDGSLSEALLSTATPAAAADDPAPVEEDGRPPEEQARELAAVNALIDETLAADDARCAQLESLPPIVLCQLGSTTAGLVTTTHAADEPLPGSEIQCTPQGVCASDLQAQLEKNAKDLKAAVEAEKKARDTYDAVKKGHDQNKAYSDAELDQASLRLARAVASLEGLQALKRALEARLKLCTDPDDADANCSLAIAVERAAKAALTLAKEEARVAKENLRRAQAAFNRRIINATALQAAQDAVKKADKAVVDADKDLKDATAKVLLLCPEK